MGEAKGIIFKIEHQVERVLNLKEVRINETIQIKERHPSIQGWN